LGHLSYAHIGQARIAEAAQQSQGQVIKTLKPRLKPMGQRIRSTREIRDTRYSADATVRSWYKSERWQELRRQVFARDLYTCQRSGELCIGKHPAPNSPVANHKIPHHGDPELFWDIDNIETVTKAVHDSLIQSEERKAG